MSNNNKVKVPNISSFRKVGSLVCLSGQVGINSDKTYVDSDFEEETKQVFRNIEKLLTSVGLDFSNVVVIRGYLVSFDFFETFNEIWDEIFKNNPPARTVVQVGLHPPFRVELEVIAESNVG